MMDRRGYKFDAKDPRLPRVKRQLRVAPIDRSGIQAFPQHFDVWYADGAGNVFVPRFFVEEFVLVTPGKPIDVDFEGRLKPELDQPAAVDAVMQSLRRTGGAVLSLRTGGGKTTCACYVISQLRTKTIVLVHKDVLRIQWAERIAQFLPSANVSFVQGSQVDLSGDVVIAMIQTLVSPGRRFDFADFGFVICDECHRIAAETFSTAMRGLCCQYSLGLSATPTRKDGLSKVMHWFLGKMAYCAAPERMRHVTVEIVKYASPRYRLPPPMTRFGTVNHAAFLTDLADDPQRTEVIVDWVLRLREDPERIVLVLSHRRDHCKELAAKIPGAVAFLGGTKATKTTGHLTAPVVCATFALASEGYDDPRLNALVLATPCSDVTQAAGRILRGVSEKDPIIVDLCDEYSVAYAQAARRKEYYRKAGFRYASQVTTEFPKCVIID